MRREGIDCDPQSKAAVPTSRGGAISTGPRPPSETVPRVVPLGMTSTATVIGPPGSVANRIVDQLGDHDP